MSGGDDRPLTDADYQALARFRAGLRRFLNFSEQAARAEGITSAQHQLMLAIRGHPATDGPPSVTDLAAVLQRQRHSIVGLLDRAEEHGLVHSEPDHRDARRRLVTLTPKGATILERLSELHRHELRSFERDFVDVLRRLR